MTKDQKTAFGLLKEAIMEDRKDRRIKEIKARLHSFETTLEPAPWWKRVFRFLKR